MQMVPHGVNALRQAIERVYSDHRQGLYTLALAITRCPGRAEDAVQEAFARLWSRRIRPSGDLVPYVFAAVRNAAIDQVRRRPPDAREPDASIYNGLPEDPSAASVTAERHRILEAAVLALPQEQREAVVLKIYGGLTFQQVAETLDAPLQTVASRYRRALEQIGRRVQPLLEPCDE